MFSYLQGRGRRNTPPNAPPSHQPEHERYINESSPLLEEDRFRDDWQRKEDWQRRAERENTHPSTAISSTAPVLPPIPRIASHYGTQGNIDFEELQRKLQQHSFETNAQDQTRHSVGSTAPAEFQRPRVEEAESHRQSETAAKRITAFHYPQYKRPPSRRVEPESSQPNNAQANTNPKPMQPYAQAYEQAPPPYVSVREQTQQPYVLAGEPKQPPYTSDREPRQQSYIPGREPIHQSYVPSRESMQQSYIQVRDSVPPVHYQSKISTSQHPILHIAPPTTIPASQPRNSKPMLNRLNPMSLLARRRSSQTSAHGNDDSSVQRRRINGSGSSIPDDYDPRIRGKVVHDFSAPRPRRNISEHSLPTLAPIRSQSGDLISHAQPRKTSLQLKIADGELSPIMEKQHTPVFKEHFGDELESWRLDENHRRNQITAGLPDRIPDETAERRSPLPTFSRKLPENARSVQPQDSPFVPPPEADLEIVSEEKPLDSPKTVVSKDFSPAVSPPKTRSRASSIMDPLVNPAELPKHMKSNASRFSFDFAGVGSAAQEKLLEEKHRQNNIRRQRESAASGLSAIASSTGGNDEDEGYGYGDMDFDDDGCEEKIPGVNADADDEFVNYNATIYGGQPTGFNNVSSVTLGLHHLHSFDNLGIDSSSVPQGLASNRFAQSQISPIQEYEEESRADNDSITTGLSGDADEDDIYFDDGIIEDVDREEGPPFDESLFDDDNSRVYGLPLRDLKPLIATHPATGDSSEQSTRPISLESRAIQTNTNTGASLGTRVTSAQPLDGLFPVRESAFIEKSDAATSGFNQAAELTHDNLAAYHNALAVAANRAALDGRFDRKSSVDETEKRTSFGEDQKMRVSFSEDLPSLHPLESYGYPDDDMGFDFDDNDDDDGIIAAANAEALENDDEGIYGREFGFFAHANGPEGAEYINGGYFGPASTEGIKRSHSGKDKFQEPTLTPITEQSEWSQRNSMVSLLHGSGSAYPSNLGLAQLADMQYDDTDLSLSALMKLRRGAWGGSNGSLRSSAGSHKSGSPSLPQAFPAHAPSGPSNVAAYITATRDVTNSDEMAHSNPGLTLQTHGLVSSPTLPSSGSESSPKRRNAVKSQGHSRASSGADSVSYVMESNEDGGGTRWVVEKRRILECGQMEILGRHLVEGGRI